MAKEILGILDDRGYLTKKSEDTILIRKKVIADWKTFLVSVTLCAVLLLIASWMPLRNYPGLSVFLIGVGVVLLFIPFFNYFSSAYKSLLIDTRNETLLFRSSFARAYRFFEIQDVTLEVLSQEESGIFNRGRKLQRYVISIILSNKSKEELVSLVFDQDQNEQVIFKLKDYFEVLLTPRTKN